MREGSHTEGGWRFGIRDDGSMWLSIGDVVGPGGHYQGDLVASVADARLIVAAPKLLRAVRAVLAWQDSTGGFCTPEDAVDVLAPLREAYEATLGEKE